MGTCALWTLAASLASVSHDNQTVFLDITRYSQRVKIVRAELVIRMSDRYRGSEQAEVGGLDTCQC